VVRIVPESIIQFKHIKDDWKQWKELTKWVRNLPKRKLKKS
jgi:hypothetical protein